MARNQETMTDEEFVAFEEAMEHQAQELRQALAEDLGGQPEAYRPRESPEGGE